MVTIEKLKRHLKSGTALVTFQKVNGDIRVMECTLADYLLPKTKTKNAARTPNKDVTVVFDLEANEWRCFKNIAVMEIELL